MSTLSAHEVADALVARLRLSVASGTMSARVTSYDDQAATITVDLSNNQRFFLSITEDDNE